MTDHLPKPPASASKPTFLFGLLLGVVVGALAAVLAGLFALRIMIPPDVWSAVGERANNSRAESDLNILSHALENYRRDHGSYPTSEQGMMPLVENGRGKYIGPIELPKDPWGRDYIYRMPGEGGEGFSIVTYGHDGVPGGSGSNADHEIGPPAETSAG